MNFFKTLLAATLGTFLALLFLFVVLLITISSSAEEAEPYIRDNTVLKIELSGSIPSQTPSNPLDELFGQGSGHKVSLENLRKNLEKAEHHDKIKGVWLQIDMITEGWANLQEARRLISDFNERSDKFVYANTNDIGFNEKGYFLATAADSVFSPPETYFEFDGFFSQVTFYDGLFEKLGIEAEISRHGEYKGAVEPYYRRELSDENEHQLTEILNEVHSTYLTEVANKSGYSAEELNAILDSQPQLTSAFAFEQGFLDSLLYEEDFESLMKTRLGINEDSKLQTVSHNRYSRVSRGTAGAPVGTSSDKIAVIYADGPILPDVDSDSPFSNEQYITVDFIEEQLGEIRDDSDIKALVVRVNSPGGASSTSDIIWNKLKEMKKEIPVIVSMGPVAASGGYYISMAADSIVAEPTTITGSIGVFGAKFNMKELFNDKLGITFDGIKTNDHADWLTINRGFTAGEAKAFQQFIDRSYLSFIEKVAESRNMEVEEVDAIAQGRVWTGSDAKENGLVDVLGGMNEAVELAAGKAEISEYALETYPKPKTFFDVLMGSADAQVKNLFDGIGLWHHPEIDKFRNQVEMLSKGHTLALFPYEIIVE